MTKRRAFPPLHEADLAADPFAQFAAWYEIAADPRGALILYWREHDRQVRARGPIERLPAADSDAYFASRSRESRLGAWASPQSRPLEDRAELDRRLAAVRERFADVDDVPRPDFWGGFVLRPEAIEFWQGQQARLHDRFLYSHSPDNAGGWRIQRLAP
jgi:pyridoxamine 5'-phosphate oxidase